MQIQRLQLNMCYRLTLSGQGKAFKFPMLRTTNMMAVLWCLFCRVPTIVLLGDMFAVQLQLVCVHVCVSCVQFEYPKFIDAVWTFFICQTSASDTWECWIFICQTSASDTWECWIVH